MQFDVGGDVQSSFSRCKNHTSKTRQALHSKPVHAQPLGAEVVPRLELFIAGIVGLAQGIPNIANTTLKHVMLLSEGNTSGWTKSKIDKATLKHVDGFKGSTTLDCTLFKAAAEDLSHALLNTSNATPILIVNFNVKVDSECWLNNAAGDSFIFKTLRSGGGNPVWQESTVEMVKNMRPPLHVKDIKPRQAMLLDSAITSVHTKPSMSADMTERGQNFEKVEKLGCAGSTTSIKKLSHVFPQVSVATPRQRHACTSSVFSKLLSWNANKKGSACACNLETSSEPR